MKKKSKIELIMLNRKINR